MNDTFSLEVELCLEAGNETGLVAVWPFGASCWFGLAGTAYGLFLTTPFFFMFCLELVLSLCRFLRLAKRFIQLANGLRRACLSGMVLVGPEK